MAFAKRCDGTSRCGPAVLALLELAVLLTIWRTHFSAAQQVPLLCGTSGLGPRSWARAPPPRRARRPPPAASARPSSREVRCGAARRLRSVTPAWEASALAARPPSGDLRVARLPSVPLRERAPPSSLPARLLRSLRVKEAAGVQVQDALAPVLQVRPSRRSPSRRAANEPSATVTGPSPRPPPPARQSPAASRPPRLAQFLEPPSPVQDEVVGLLRLLRRSRLGVQPLPPNEHKLVRLSFDCFWGAAR